ncbi:uncharacterized protein BDW43DRAFT_322531 [Aspergillus alliaceus]|uniref:uncharacterized protein n=1 Tax=Petromyces alliaceus TaxID=209559 RepID=UPI0012A40422|nr:uncharacterized protein BDW43DRAFT_322531 [Aspergillus alliaceus]KAB8228884.1 hypothetical protein BDW43DRAFT_322531 [Aspergillus alliaceus]
MPRKAVGSFTYGFNSAVIGSVPGLPSFLNYFCLNTSGPDASERSSSIGATNGLFAVGGIIGCLIVLSMLDALGRRLSIQIIAFICIISAAIQTGSVHIAMILAGQFINGVGVGMMDVSVPIYQSEISLPKARGRMVGSHGFLVVCGYAMAGWAGYGCFFATKEALQWRLCLALQMVAPLLLLIGSLWMPESPRWLCTKDRTEAAFAILRKFHHTEDDVNDIFVQQELRHICILVSIERQETQGHGLRSLLKRKSSRRRLLMVFFLVTRCIAQSKGVLACYNTWAAIMNFVNSLMLDRRGRIRIMVIGIIGCSLSLSGFSAMVAVFGGTSSKVGNGLGGNMDTPSYVVGISVSGFFIMTLIYTQAAPTSFDQVGWQYLLVFIITAGLSLEEIARLFGDETPDDSHDEKASGCLARMSRRCPWLGI